MIYEQNGERETTNEQFVLELLCIPHQVMLMLTEASYISFHGLVLHFIATANHKNRLNCMLCHTSNSATEILPGTENSGFKLCTVIYSGLLRHCTAVEYIQ
jgi:hypothetical protein